MTKRTPQETVTVVIPTWNRARLIGKTIDSVLLQTFPALEILVCDDASTDDTRAVVAARQDPRVRLIEAAENSGFGGASRNRGIRAARGDWIAFVDDDDLWAPEKLSRQLDAARHHDCRAVSTEAWRSGPDIAKPVLLANRESGNLSFETLLDCNYVVCSSAMIRRSLLAMVGFFPEDMLCQDYALWLRVCCFTDFFFLSEPLVDYWDDPKTSVRRKTTTQADQQIAVLENFKGWLLTAQVPDKAAILFKVQTKLDHWRTLARSAAV